MKAMIALIIAFATQPGCVLSASAQAPAVAGRWQIELTFTDTSHHSFRFETGDSNKGSFLLLDRRSSLLEPPKPTEAEWSQEGSTVKFWGAVEFPIGNVGRDPGKLVFAGSFESADLITGEVQFFATRPDVKDPSLPSKTGTFRATRIAADGSPKVQLLLPEPGRKLRRGREAEISWQAESSIPISLQQVFLSVDRGESFVPITDILNGEETRVMWAVPDSMPVAKKALFRIVVVNSAGDSAEDTSKETFKIR